MIYLKCSDGTHRSCKGMPLKDILSGLAIDGITAIEISEAEYISIKNYAKTKAEEISQRDGILLQIIALESTCTERRWREHILGINTTFIPSVESKVAALRTLLGKL